MNFHEVATEIMLRINDEKWYETRDKIALALEDACAYGMAPWMNRDNVRQVETVLTTTKPLSDADVTWLLAGNRDFYDYRAQGDGQP